MTDLFAALDATWPAASSRLAGGWRIREGRGGGKRVSSATAESAEAPDQIAIAEAVQAAFGQPPLFCLRPGDAEADAALAARGYRIVDPVAIYAAPVARIAAEPPERMTGFPIWPPLAIVTDIWAGAGIGPERQDVMHRVIGPKTAILGRESDRAAGAVFVALHRDTAMIHALHVDPDRRRKGLARNLMRAAAGWAAGQGAAQIALAVTSANEPARALYQALGMAVVTEYHYRAR